MPPTQRLKAVLSCSHALMPPCSHLQSRAAFWESKVVIVHQNRKHVALDDLNWRFQILKNDCMVLLHLLLLYCRFVFQYSIIFQSNKYCNTLHIKRDGYPWCMVSNIQIMHLANVCCSSVCFMFSVVIHQLHCVTIWNRDLMHPHACRVYVFVCVYASSPSRMLACGMSGSKLQEPNRHYYS